MSMFANETLFIQCFAAIQKTHEKRHVWSYFTIHKQLRMQTLARKLIWHTPLWANIQWNVNFFNGRVNLAGTCSTRQGRGNISLKFRASSMRRANREDLLRVRMRCLNCDDISLLISSVEYWVCKLSAIFHCYWSRILFFLSCNISLLFRRYHTT